MEANLQPAPPPPHQPFFKPTKPEPISTTAKETRPSADDAGDLAKGVKRRDTKRATVVRRSQNSSESVSLLKDIEDAKEKNKLQIPQRLVENEISLECIHNV
ncbi:hypothetical protein H310_09775 [Aphanomyces invadans]|uniref:Uncharacterized protein n=1 Tax=Aphanomyces invadans TaxID=157072 RepID=A0A024TS12_9STRA|nr:hypothetical protein H310_09775 [Aphanomyces invadans]ETV96910.1 hypothetical protein H310_09775 [Aphanomyces invadans]|eukprot:XP_008874156.1 hypothetical protein H310_09775 [Aphanomyces invadans]